MSRLESVGEGRGGRDPKLGPSAHDEWVVGGWAGVGHTGGDGGGITSRPQPPLPGSGESRAPETGREVVRGIKRETWVTIVGDPLLDQSTDPGRGRGWS